ncbi:histidine-type phosphatase [Epilithonimonas zeae]|uniref:Multiple inositol polyphosphate phosphatase 1 n=1 Tax=Epilithonimonas zeae TaxID=1416779 RepID=A0A1N6FB55_9FLAO|nr:histidine-type phosphatase [Epilithonimonas zeae]SIN92477.1 Histidine phosphatase superfamily (branch 2) [Epilithonimonas zeae]
MKKSFSILLLAASFFYQGQTTKEEILSDLNQTGGVYYAYPTPTKKLTAVPSGYQPFYISHYGRHGSRWLINDKDFSGVMDILRKANENNALTENGKSALQRLEKIWKIAEGHNGDLTELGGLQHKQISQRMFKNNPQVFGNNAVVTAKSTVVPRCIISMAYFTNELTANNPKLNISVESSDKYMKYLNHHTKESIDFKSQDNFWQEEKRKLKQDALRSDRFIKNLFNNDEYVYKNVNPEKVVESFYWIASDMQNLETDISFYDLFTKDELFNIYQAINYQFYVNDAASPLSKGLVKNNAIPLVKNILEEAEDYIKNNKSGASLRFGHDGNIAPLLAFMRVEGMDKEEINPREVYKVWNTFQAAPMAANLQMIFYKNKKSDVLVKFLLNENEVSIPVETKSFPYYQWNEVKTYLEKMTKSN